MVWLGIVLSVYKYNSQYYWSEQSADAIVLMCHSQAKPRMNVYMKLKTVLLGKAKSYKNRYQ